MKKEILKRLEVEIKACQKYSENAEKKAKEGKFGLAINLLDIAEMARQCAAQAHEDLWKASDGKLTEEEFELFCRAETLDKTVQKGYSQIQKARK